MLRPIEERLVSLAAEHNRPLVASKLRHLFASAMCPECGVEFPIGNALA